MSTTTTATYSPPIQSLLSRHLSAPSHNPYTAPPTLTALISTISSSLDRSLPLILSCADPRVVPEAIFNLSPGEAVVIRNAGGDVKKALPDILTIDRLVRCTDVVVVRHTDCGTTFFHDEDVRKDLKAREGVTAEMKNTVDGWRFGEVRDGVKEALKMDVELLKSTPLMRPELKGRIVGFVYDLETGDLKPLE